MFEIQAALQAGIETPATGLCPGIAAVLVTLLPLQQGCGGQGQRVGCGRDRGREERVAVTFDQAGIEIGRKVLADIAVHDKAAFAGIVAQAKAKLA